MGDDRARHLPSRSLRARPLAMSYLLPHRGQVARRPGHLDGRGARRGPPLRARRRRDLHADGRGASSRICSSPPRAGPVRPRARLTAPPSLPPPRRPWPAWRTRRRTSRCFTAWTSTRCPTRARCTSTRPVHGDVFLSKQTHHDRSRVAGNNNKVNWAMDDKQEFIDICEVVYAGASKGRGLVVSPKDYSTKYTAARRAARTTVVSGVLSKGLIPAVRTSASSRRFVRSFRSRTSRTPPCVTVYRARPCGSRGRAYRTRARVSLRAASARGARRVRGGLAARRRTEARRRRPVSRARRP